MSHARRSAPAAILLSLLLAVTTACTSSNTDSKDDNYPTGRDVGNSASDAIQPPATDPGRMNGGKTPAPDTDGFCNDPELANKYGDAFCENLRNGTLWYDPDSRQKKMTYKANRTPHSTLYAGKVNVQAFLLAAMRSQRDTWRWYFDGSGISVPDFSADIVTGTETFKSSCPIGLGDGKTATVKADSPRVLYCPSAQGTRDQIAFPALTLARLWKGHDRKTADMAAAIVASRAGGLELNRALALHGGGSTIDPYLASSCLAGVWARGAYPQSDASDLDRAVNYARRVMVEIGNGTDPSGISDKLDLAWFAGYQSGDANTCGDSAGWLQKQHEEDLLGETP